MASFLQRSLDLPPAQNSRFNDTADSTHAGAINAVAEAGIAGGYSDGTFRPQESVTCAQMASLLARAFN